MSINARYSRNDLFEDMSYNLVFRPGLSTDRSVCTGHKKIRDNISIRVLYVCIFYFHT